MTADLPDVPPDVKTAWHEAGHAIAALVLGLPVGEVRIGLPEGGGVCTFTGRVAKPCDLAATVAGRESIMDGTIVLMAGEAAVRLKWPWLLVRLDVSHDDEQAERMATALHHGEGEVAQAFLHYARAQARALLRNRWPSVEAVATALQIHRTLTGDDVRGIMRGDRFFPRRYAIQGRPRQTFVRVRFCEKIGSDTHERG